MLQSIRNNAQGIVSKILVSLIAFTFVIWGAESLFSFSTGSSAPAAVNGTEISLQKLAQATELNRRQVLFSNPELDPVTLDVQAIQASTLEQLIKQSIFLQQAEKSGMAIGNNAVDQMIVESTDFQIDGKFDLERFQSLIANVGLTASAYKQQLIENNLVNQMHQGITASAFTLPEQANLVAALDGQTRSFDILVLPFAKQLEATTISTQQIATHFAANKDQYTSPEQVQVDYLILSKDQFKDQVVVTDEQLQAAYAEAQQQHDAEAEREAAHILFNVNDKQTEADALALAEQAHTELQGGADFALVAAKYSQDSGTANDGGSLGVVLADDFGGAFDDTLFALQAGEYSKPVVTQFGVQIIKLQGLTDNSYPSFAEKKDSLQENLQSQGAEALFVAASETMSDLAFSSPDLQELSAEFELDIQQSAWFDRMGASEFGEQAQRVAKMAFAEDVLVQNNNSEVIELTSDQLLVLHLKQHKPAAELALADVSERISEQLGQQQALQDLQTLADSYVKELEAGADMATIANKAQSQWQNFDDLPRLSNSVSPMLSQSAFKLPRPQQSDVFGSSTDFTGDVSVIRLHQVTDGNTDTLNKEQRESLNNALANIQGQADIIAFEAELNNKAEIERF
ncbi:MAG: SurA N-terminal domain-containing protein [Gammaproteobacteria bacterium]|jgi:peptidyl-prolyl cis-trans isomerase D|nr:SurA N-terminal domain-containing protein [Gammaproteobacteria bacterium]